MPSNHLILCCPILLLPPIFPRIRVFSIESAVCIRWSKVLELQLQHQYLQLIYSGLISFRMGWLDLAVQGTLKKASYVITYCHRHSFTLIKYYILKEVNKNLSLKKSHQVGEVWGLSPSPRLFSLIHCHIHLGVPTLGPTFPPRCPVPAECPTRLLPHSSAGEGQIGLECKVGGRGGYPASGRARASWGGQMQWREVQSLGNPPSFWPRALT